MTTTHFNTISIVESIPEGQLNTARRLHEDLLTYRAAFPPAPAVRLSRVESASAFAEHVASMAQEASTSNLRPLLHIECHGNRLGLEFADNSFMTWSELRPVLTGLNISTHLNLLVTVAACEGGALMATVSISDRAPIAALIGPTTETAPAALEKAFSAFFLTLLQTRSPKAAIAALSDATADAPFLRTTSLRIFNDVWRNYKLVHCEPAALADRARNMATRVASESPLAAIPSSEMLLARLSEDEPWAFERFRSTYFMYDLFPSHAERFQVAYIP